MLILKKDYDASTEKVIQNNRKAFCFRTLIDHNSKEKLLVEWKQRLSEYLYDFFRSRTGLLKTYGVNKYYEVLNNLNLKKNEQRMIKLIFKIYTLKINKSF
jgi:hypothetical protein